jgi:phage tail-like protein
MTDQGQSLLSPHPLGETLPSVYLTDFFAQRLCATFDDLLAPVFATLDCFPAYLDPGTTPEDMLDWLAGWIGLTFDAHIDAARKRELIAVGAALLPWRGTVAGVREAVVAAFNAETEIIESGGVQWSTRPNSDAGGAPVQALLVRIVTDDPDSIDLRRLDDVVEAVKPAHVSHRVEAVRRGDR